MALVGKLFKHAISLNDLFMRHQTNIQESQHHTLARLIRKAARTSFGQTHQFESILKQPNMVDHFQRTVPFLDYETIYARWWHRALSGEPNVCWPGKTRYFALTSGTTGASSKKVPVTDDMLLAIRKAGLRHYSTLHDLNLPDQFYQKQSLVLGGSTHLTRIGEVSEGDLSGILTGNLPSWFSLLARPGRQIAMERDWNIKLDRITRSAKDWDIAMVMGVPAWVQLLFERIIKHYRLNNIHEIWPNLSVYVHGGVCFDPYRQCFNKLLGRHLFYFETYLASEGFLAFERQHKSGVMELVMDNGIFYEFIPFNANNFNQIGQVRPNAQAIPLSKVQANKEYAIVITTCAGAWRYLLGDTVRFTNPEKLEMRISGRVSHFLNVCGEHLSLANMNQAITLVGRKLGIEIKEFTVASVRHQNLFAHYWYLGVNSGAHSEAVKLVLDETLKELNDDYRTERSAALKEVFVDLIPAQRFYEWMEKNGQIGAQRKFPRVMSVEQFKRWQAFVHPQTSSVCKVPL